jgi:ubiquinol-cytochrome c reductase cytochrome b subunit
MFFLTGAVLSLLGGLAQINPIWLYGPYRPGDVSSASQPDWYMGWLDGGLRLMPSLEIRAFGHEIPNPFFPGVLLPGITFTLLFLWPFLEARFSGDREPHHLLDRPRDRPLRTAFGVSTLTFYTVLFFGGASDVLAITFNLSVNALFASLQVMLFVLPPLFGWFAFRLCKELAARDRPGTSAQATVPGVRAPGDGSDVRREVAPPDEAEQEPASAGVPRR